MRDPAGMAILFQVTALIGWAPWLIVLTIGGVVCLRRLSKQPREGWLVLGAIVLSVTARFGVPSLMALSMMLGVSINSGNRNWLWPLLSEFPGATLQAAAWGLLIYAAFGGGRTAKSKYLIEDQIDQPVE